MSIRRFIIRGFAACLAGLALTGLTHAQVQRTEDVTLSVISGSSAPIIIDQDSPSARLDFTIAPGAVPNRIEFSMSGAPLSREAGGVLSVAINEGRAITLSPRAQSFDAQFTLYSEALRAGPNSLRLTFEGEDGVDGWRISQSESRLRVSATPELDFATLSDFEAALEADFAGPQRISLDTQIEGQTGLVVDAMLAQGLALRMGEAPVFVAEPQLAELVIRTRLDPALEGPRLRIAEGRVLYVEAGTPEDLINASRLFAARRLAGQGATFTPAQALSAPSLGETLASVDGFTQDLTHFARSATPFSQNQGAQTAVVFATETPEDHMAALAVLSRSALAGGQAWVFAWYGDSLEAAPNTHNLLYLGDLNALDRQYLSHAPEELRAATDAAQNRNPNRRRFQFGSAAYADEPETLSSVLTGIASVYRLTPNRWIGVVAAPDGADFARAARRLARSEDLWSNLSGRAALWDVSSVMPFGEPLTPEAKALAAFDFVRAHDRWFALGLFSISVFLLLMGGSVNRKSKVSA